MIVLIENEVMLEPPEYFNAIILYREQPEGLLSAALGAPTRPECIGGAKFPIVAL